MTTAITIEARVLGQKRLAPEWTVPIPEVGGGERLLLRDLITQVVLAEVSAFHERQVERRLIQILTPEAIARGVEKGKVDLGGRDFAQVVEPQAAVDTALQAFEDGLYFVFVDGEQQTALPLARTAGYRDPVRLQWAMEARAVADLAAGPLTATVGDVTVSLSVTVSGEAELTVAKGGRPLKAIPAAAKKDPAVVALHTQQREVRRQGSRVRLSLEQAMCRGDSFTGAELRELFRHPVLAPMLRGLVFICADTMGYPIERALALEAHDGTVSPIGDDDTLRIAHSHDLLVTGAWQLWQSECFTRERIQPFKQVFRELYVLTRTEQEDRTVSRRYAGHQVQPKRAMALLGQRGWVNHPEEGLRRTFHEAGISAWLTFLGTTLSPADVEGLTIEGVGFSRYGEWKPLPLEEVPARIFSEVMRDVDLVVSVAHQGGVDPEAGASTVEMRTTLIQQTCALLKITNVRLQGAHALIEGDLGSYSVHLGSAVVHRQPGGALCIVPVHAQHRGRLFLPFADDDPKTAEVLSKILLLARDKEIKDPTILGQIMA